MRNKELIDGGSAFVDGGNSSIFPVGWISQGSGSWVKGVEENVL